MRTPLAMLVVVASCVGHDPLPPKGGGNDGGAGSGGGSGSGETSSQPITFDGAKPGNPAFPHGLFNDVHNHIAVGGTDEIHLERVRGGMLVDFDLPFSAVSAMPDMIEVEHVEGPTVQLRGHGGTAQLRIVDPGGALYDREAYASSARARIVPVPTHELVTATDLFHAAAPSFVFAAGTQTITFAMLNDTTNRLVDTSMSIALPGSTQDAWDTVTVANATPGHKAAVVHTGDGAMTAVDVEVVAGIDSIVPIYAESSFACFAALAHGTYVAGLTWTFTIDGTVVPGQDSLSRNCVLGTSGAFTVTASAGGKTATVTTTP